MGVERREQAIQTWSATNCRAGGVDEQVKAVCDLRSGSQGGISQGQGQQGGRRRRRGDDRRVRKGPGREPVQALESYVLGELLSATRASSRDTEAGWEGDTSARSAHDRGPSCPNSGGDVPGTRGGTDVPPRLLRVPARAVGQTGAGALSRAMQPARVSHLTSAG